MSRLQGDVVATSPANAGSLAIPYANGTATISPTASTGIAALNVNGTGSTIIGGALTSLTATSSIFHAGRRRSRPASRTLCHPHAGGAVGCHVQRHHGGGRNHFSFDGLCRATFFVVNNIQYPIIAVPSNTLLYTSVAVPTFASGFTVIRTGAVGIQGPGHDYHDARQLSRPPPGPGRRSTRSCCSTISSS